MFLVKRKLKSDNKYERKGATALNVYLYMILSANFFMFLKQELLGTQYLILVKSLFCFFVMNYLYSEANINKYHVNTFNWYKEKFNLKGKGSFEFLNGVIIACVMAGLIPVLNVENKTAIIFLCSYFGLEFFMINILAFYYNKISTSTVKESDILKIDYLTDIEEYEKTYFKNRVIEIIDKDGKVTRSEIIDIINSLENIIKDKLESNKINESKSSYSKLMKDRY